jgi:hypothetical protein
MSKASELANLIGNINAGGGGVNRNVIINGAMNVAQRGTSTTGLGANGANYSTVDRFYTYANGTDGRFTMTQDSSAPDGFANSLKLACTTADTSIAAAEQLLLAQVIEGQNLQHLNKGTSSALPVAISFYVKGNASATYMCALMDNDNNRMSTKQFSVTTDWTRITINVPADTTGALDDDNAGSFNLNFYLHAGSNLTGGTYTASTWGANTDANRAVGISSFFDSTDRTFFITGVQLEVGQNPTDFEHEPVERTLAKCQRYYFKFLEGATKEIGPGWFYNATYMSTIFRFPTTMRATPTATSTSGTNMYIIYRENTGDGFDDLTFENGSTEQYSAYNSDEVGSATAGAAGIVRSHPSAGGSAKVEFAAEL